MKKILIFVLLILCCTISVFGGEFEDTLKKAEQGDAYSQTVIGDKYYTGEELKQNYIQAAYWFKKATEQGNVFAGYKLGWMYDNGEGVPQDYKKAV